jgi:hypothetical protein
MKRDLYEQWRPALIAFYRAESPWMAQKLANLATGCPLSLDDKHVIDGLMAAREAA